MDLFFTAAGYVLLAVGWAGTLTRRLSPRAADAVFFLMSACFLVSDAARGDRIAASVQAAFCAVFAYFWWHRGGGDGTRRRLRSLRRKFSGVRRTAPQPTA